VAHRRLVAPQLGAPGVAAHEVQTATGFRITWGPVRAADLPAFLDARMKATPEMRRVRFGLRDRLTLIPVELVTGSRHALPAAAAVFLLGGLGSHGYSFAGLANTGLAGSALVVAAFVTAQVLGPILLPWLPGRAFAVKGAVLGVGLAAALAASGLSGSWLHTAAWFALAPAITSFFVMNFTGATTCTSLSGVLREMRFAVPAQIAGGAVGLGLWLAGLFLPGGPAR
jgi:acetyl-CoA decarbonylase/synthase complex subunit gamma